MNGEYYSCASRYRLQGIFYDMNKEESLLSEDTWAFFCETQLSSRTVQGKSQAQARNILEDARGKSISKALAELIYI